MSNLSGHLSQWLFDKLCEQAGPLSLGGELYDFADKDDVEKLGFDPNDVTLLLLRRRSDGAFFDVDIDVTAHRQTPEPPFNQNHYRYHTPNQPLAGCAWCEHVGWLKS